jgi:hypothetical protein
MEAYDPATVFSSIDVQGRYAYGNQPGIAHWNLARLAEALLPLIDSDSERAIEAAKRRIQRFPARFGDAHSAGVAAKLGSRATRRRRDRELARRFLRALKDDGADFTLAFRFLADESHPGAPAAAPARCSSPALHSWSGCRAGSSAWSARTRTADERQRRMFASSPAFIPRNHLVQHCIEAAEGGDFAPFHRLVERLARPFDWAASDRDLARPATDRRSACTGLSVAPEPRRLRNGSRSAVRHRGRRALSKRPGSRIIASQPPVSFLDPTLSIAFFGKTLSGPFTIPSGIVTTAPSIIQYFLDEVPQLGVITTKSIGLAPRAGNREPVYSQYAPGCFVNAVGLTNPGAEAALAGLEALEVPEDRFLLTSIFGGSVEEFVRVAELLAPVSDGLELNLSCPHASATAWPWARIRNWYVKSSLR